MAIVISGVNNNDKITASDGTIDLLSGVSYADTITAPGFTANGNITAASINIGSGIQLGNAGIVTATTFVGNLNGNINGSAGTLLLQTSGSERIRIGPQGQIGIAGANYGTSGQVLTSGGSGSSVTWSTISGTTINNNADNRLITGSGTANTLEGEANLTFETSTSGGTLTVAGTSEYQIKLKDTNNSGNAAETALAFTDSGNTIQGFVGYNYWGDGNLDIQNNNSGGDVCINTGGENERLRIKSNGDVSLIDGNLIVAAGHGIDFSATSDATHTAVTSGAQPSTDSEVLSDYEHGTWTPRLRAYDHTGGAGWNTMKYTDGTEVTGTGRYVRIGNHVWAGFKFESGSKVFDSNWTYWSIDSTPYGANHYDKASGSLYVSQTNFFTDSNSHIGGFVHGNESYMVVNKPNGHSNATINSSNNNRYCYGHISIYTSRT